MRQCRQILFPIICLLLIVQPVVAQHSAPDAEIVLLMDESGSMRRTDPQRARIRSAELLVTLLQDEQKISIVRFADGAQVALPLQPIGNAASKDRIRQLIRSLGESGEWTDINAGVELAARQFSDSSSSEKILLLFTDGEVDLAEGPELEKRSLRQLRTATLEMCQERQVSVHALAYTEAADHALLRELAESTNGLFYHGDDAQSLHLLFMQISESVAKPQGIPIVDSGVMIDDSVKEATFVVTRINKASPLTLSSPNGKVFRASTRQTEEVRWFEAPEFDVVTITNPMAGQWIIDPAPGPQDRVQIVTDLELAIAPPPTLILGDDPIRVEAWLSSQGKPLKDPTLLSTLEMRAQSTQGDFSFHLSSNSEGEFVWEGKPPSIEGTCRVAVKAQAKTFQRLRQFDFEVRKNWAEASIEVERSQIGHPLVVDGRLRISPQQLLQTQIRALIVDPKGSRYEMDLPPVMAGLYSNAFTQTSTPGAYSVTVRIEAKDRSGQVIKSDFGPFHYEATAKTIAAAIPQSSPTPLPTPHATPEPSPPPMPSPTPEVQIPETHPVVAAAQPEAKAPSLLDHKDIIALTLLVVLNIAGGLFFWNRLRKSTKSEKTLEERLAEAGKRIQSAIPPAQDLEIAQEEHPASLSELMLKVEAPAELTEPEVDDAPLPAEEPVAEDKAAELADAPAPEESLPETFMETLIAEQEPVESSQEQDDVNSEEDHADTPVTGAPEEDSSKCDLFMSSIDLTPEELAEALREATESEKF